MHKYLKSIGFHGIDSEDLKLLKCDIQAHPDMQSFTVSDGESGTLEFRKEYSFHTGITIKGFQDYEDGFQEEYYYPYFEGTAISTNEDVEIVKTSDRDSYQGIVDDPRQHKAKRVRIVVEYIDSSLERYIKDHTDSKGNLKPKSVTLSPEHIGKTITCAGCKEAIHYGKPFAYYGQSAYCSKKCCVDHIWDGDNNRLFDVDPNGSLEEYDREFVRYYIRE